MSTIPSFLRHISQIEIFQLHPLEQSSKMVHGMYTLVGSCLKRGWRYLCLGKASYKCMIQIILSKSWAVVTWTICCISKASLGNSCFPLFSLMVSATYIRLFWRLAKTIVTLWKSCPFHWPQREPRWLACDKESKCQTFETGRDKPSEERANAEAVLC